MRNSQGRLIYKYIWHTWHNVCPLDIRVVVRCDNVCPLDIRVVVRCDFCEPTMTRITDLEKCLNLPVVLKSDWFFNLHFKIDNCPWQMLEKTFYGLEKWWPQRYVSFLCILHISLHLQRFNDFVIIPVTTYPWSLFSMLHIVIWWTCSYFITVYWPICQVIQTLFNELTWGFKFRFLSFCVCFQEHTFKQNFFFAKWNISYLIYRPATAKLNISGV